MVGRDSLDQIQRWMQTVIMHPDGITAGITSDSARQRIDVSVENVDSIIRPSRRQTSIERLQVYGNAYYARLLECLRQEYPALVHALGGELFDGFAFGYLQAFPSQSYTLANLGRRFSQFLADTRPADISGEEGSPSWADFLIDLATVERTYSEVFDGPGSEGQRTLQPEDLEAIGLEGWPEARLIPVPCLRLLRLRYPVHEYISAVRQQGKPTVPPPAETYLVVTRRNYVVRRCAVSHEEYDLLAALAAGDTVGTAIERTAEGAHVDLDQLAADLRQWFRDWAAAGYFQAAELAD